MNATPQKNNNARVNFNPDNFGNSGNSKNSSNSRIAPASRFMNGLQDQDDEETNLTVQASIDAAEERAEQDQINSQAFEIEQIEINEQEEIERQQQIDMQQAQFRAQVDNQNLADQEAKNPGLSPEQQVKQQDFAEKIKKEEGREEKTNLSFGWFIIALIVAVIVDAAGLFFSFLAIFITPIGVAAIWFAHVLDGIGMKAAAKRLSVAGIVELIPFANMLPSLTAAVLLPKLIPLFKKFTGSVGGVVGDIGDKVVGVASGAAVGGVAGSMIGGSTGNTRDKNTPGQSAQRSLK